MKSSPTVPLLAHGKCESCDDLRVPERFSSSLSCFFPLEKGDLKVSRPLGVLREKTRSFTTRSTRGEGEPTSTDRLYPREHGLFRRVSNGTNLGVPGPFRRLTCSSLSHSLEGSPTTVPCHRLGSPWVTRVHGSKGEPSTSRPSHTSKQLREERRTRVNP